MSAAGRFSPQGCAHVRDASDLFSAGARLINYSAESTNAPSQLLGLLIFMLGVEYFLFSQWTKSMIAMFFLLSSLQSVSAIWSHKGAGVFNPFRAALIYRPRLRWWIIGHQCCGRMRACQCQARAIYPKTSRFSDKNWLVFLAIYFPHYSSAQLRAPRSPRYKSGRASQGVPPKWIVATLTADSICGARAAFGRCRNEQPGIIVATHTFTPCSLPGWDTGNSTLFELQTTQGLPRLPVKFVIKLAL